MAVKASASITVAKERDISSVTRFYMIAASSSTPSQPSGTADPSGWSKAEPAYDGTSTNSLYNTDRTIFTDGTASWSPVSKSSSYEAAKQAYNEAQNAKKTATDYLTESSADGLMVHPSSDSTTGWRIKDALELLVSGVSHIWAGIQNSVALVRIGLATAGNVIMSGDGFVDVRNSSTVMAHFGYGSGASTSGTATAPYYTLGRRKSGTTIGNWSMAEGYDTQASGAYSHAEGHGTQAIGYDSHAEGYQTYAGINAHAEGYQTTAGYYTYPAHAEGYLSEATGAYTHAAGWASIASKMGQTVIGEFNLEDTGDRVRSGFSHGDYAFIIGNGTHSGGRSNAFTVDWDGVVDCAGGFKVSGNKLFKIATCSKDNISISKSSTASGDITPTAYSGYTPIGVIGYNLNSASSSGANLTNCVPLEIYFSSGTVSYQIKNNNSSSAAKIKVVARVLYVRSELV